jgi:putative endonuclease
MPGPSADKARAQKRGRLAETLCAFLLRLKGYRILARNLREPVGEVDIVARRGKTLVFVEVKARHTKAAALEAVSTKQRQRIINAAQIYLAKHPDCANLHVRFDVMAVAPGGWPAHIRSAWEAG